VKLMETRIAEAPTIDDVREELEGEIRQQAVEARVTETLENAAIERMVEGIDPAILKDETILGN
jgi:peptidyl-prolyl cis-trans isomerase C